MGARLKSRAHQELATGWHAEAFARTKQLKPLGDYLMDDDERARRGAGRVLALAKAVKAKQEQTDGTG